MAPYKSFAFIYVFITFCVTVHLCEYLLYAASDVCGAIQALVLSDVIILLTVHVILRMTTNMFFWDSSSRGSQSTATPRESRGSTLGRDELEVTNPSNRCKQYLAGIILIPQMVTHGAVIAWPLVSTKYTKEKYELGEFTTTWFSTVIHCGGFLAMVLLACLLDRVGSKNIMFVLMFPCIAGWLFLTFANKFASILSGRLVTGFCSFTSMLMVPVYMVESAETEIRGRAGLIPNFGIPIGILYVTSLEYVINDFTLLSFMCVLPPALGLILLLFIPESPYYLLQINDVPKAEKALQWLRGKDNHVSPELRSMRRFVMANDPKRSSLNARLKRPDLRKSILMGALVAFGQELTGIHAMFSYISLTKEKTEHQFLPVWTLSGIISGSAMLFGVLIAVLLCDRVGRKPLLIGSSCVMGIAFLSMGWLLLAADVTELWWLIYAIFFIYHFAFACGWGPVPWFLLSELFPLEIRGFGLSVCLMLNLVVRWVVIHCYTAFLDPGYVTILYFLYGCLNYVAAVSVYCFVFETKHKSLSEIKIMFGNLSS